MTDYWLFQNEQRQINTIKLKYSQTKFECSNLKTISEKVKLKFAI